MTEGRTPLLKNKFFMVDEVTALDMLPEGAMYVFRDMVLDNPYGKPHIRGGFNELISDTTNGACGTIVDTLAPDGTNIILAGSSGRIEYLGAGTWTDFQTLQNQTDGKFRWTIFGEYLFITTGEDTPTMNTTSAWGTPLSIITYNLEIPKPDLTSTTIMRVNSSVGDLNPNAYYMWVVVYKTDTGDLSPPSNALYIFSSTNGVGQTSATQLAFVLANLPVSTDPRVTSKVIYRTQGYSPTIGEPKQGKFFYKVGEIDNDVTFFEDNVSDENMTFSDVPIFLRAPRTADHIITHGDRVFMSNLTVPDFFYIHTMQPAVTPTQAGVADPYTPVSGGWSYAWTGSGEFEVNTTAGSGNITGGANYYQWIMVYVDKFGKESQPIYSKVYQQIGDFDVTVGYGTMNERWYGHTGDSGQDHPDIVARRLYRNKAGSTSTFTDGNATGGYFLVKDEPTQEGRLAFTWTDNVADTDPIMSTAYDPDPYKEFKSAVAYSRVGRPFTFYLEDIKQVNQDDSDTITAMMDDGNGVLFFKQRNIYKIYTNGASQNWYLRRHINDIGCDDEWSFTIKNQTAFFRHHKRVYMMPVGSAPVDIGYYKQPTLDIYDSTLDATVTDKWAIFLTYDASASTNQTLLIYDLKLQQWYDFRFTSKSLQALMTKDHTLTSWNVGDFYLVCAGKTYEYLPDDPTDDILGTEASVTVRFPIIMPDALTEWKWRRFTINFQRNGSESISYALYDIDGEASMDTHSDSDADEGTKRIEDLESNTITSRAFLEITGKGMEQFNAIGIEVRPKRRGKFATI